MRSLRLILLLVLVAVPSGVRAQRRATARSSLTSPLIQFGHNIGDDYFLVNYTQMMDYWRKLDRESDRMRLVRIGTSSEGRAMWMAIVSRPDNLHKLSPGQQISRRLAPAEERHDRQTHALRRLAV